MCIYTSLSASRQHSLLLRSAHDAEVSGFSQHFPRYLTCNVIPVQLWLWGLQAGLFSPTFFCKHQQKALDLHGDVEQGLNWLEEIGSSALLFLHPSTLNPSYLSRDLNSGHWHGSRKGLVELVMYSTWVFASRQGKNTFIRPNEQMGALGRATGEEGERMLYRCLLFRSTPDRWPALTETPPAMLVLKATKFYSHLP